MTVSTFWSLSLLLLVPTLPLWATEISCINEDGKPVDWYVLYKLPKNIKQDTPGIGLEYMFMDSLTRAWKLSRYLINMTESALGQTLQLLYQSYKAKNSAAYAIYNDAPPNKMNYSWKHGHTKGFLLWNKHQGFWVIHSIPEFPKFPEQGYGYPPTGERNAQVAFCLTFRYDQFTEIDKQFLCYNPNIYNCSIPKLFYPELLNLQILCAGSVLPPSPWEQCLSKLQSAKGETFLSFAKTCHYRHDIYLAWMAQALKTDLFAESWQHKGYELFSNCSLPYHVYNVNLIETPWGASFSSHFDHSKWCVSRRYEDQWTCIGDLNRAPQQTSRSGGFLCTQNQDIYQAFRQLILRFYGCSFS